MKQFKKKKPHFEFLHKKWTARRNGVVEGVLDKHLRHVALGGLGGLVLFGTPGLNHHQHIQITNAGNQTNIEMAMSKNALLAAELVDKMPTDTRKLTEAEDTKIIQLIAKDLGIKVKSEIDNKRLNRTFGLIGGEQHLYRYPGDAVFEHAKDASDWAMYGGAGIAPGLGAWGYFASSKGAFTPEVEQRERYYIAVQTFLSPGFSERVAEYRDFYKYRKMLVVNPKTGQAVVADIADAGPSEYTGKHLGGSPEVMQELGLATGPRKGAVLYYFLDDSSKDIPLGPVHINEELAQKI